MPMMGGSPPQIVAITDVKYGRRAPCAFGDQHQNMKCGPGAKKIWRAALAFQIHQNGRKNNGC